MNTNALETVSIKPLFNTTPYPQYLTVCVTAMSCCRSSRRLVWRVLDYGNVRQHFTGQIGQSVLNVGHSTGRYDHITPLIFYAICTDCECCSSTNSLYVIVSRWLHVCTLQSSSSPPLVVTICLVMHSSITCHVIQFTCVFRFQVDRKYLKNGSTYRKYEKYLINYISSTIGRKNLVNFGPQTNQL